MQNKLMIRLRQNQVSIDYMRENIALKFDGMPKEDFKIIDFLDIKRNKYYISTYGRVFTIYGKELKQEESHVNNNVTYYRILLQCDKELSNGITEKRYLVHRLVAFAFIPKTKDDIVKNRDFVNHRYNTDGRCNFVWNLEWATNSENVLQSIYSTNTYSYNNSVCLKANDTKTDFNGENNPKARLSSNQVEIICESIIDGYDNRQCAINAGLDGNYKDVMIVQSIRTGRSWVSVSKKYGINNY